MPQIRQIVACTLLALAARTFAAAPPAPATAPPAGATAPTDPIESAWNDLIQHDPAGTRAMLVLAGAPEKTLVLARARLAPLRLEPEDARKLLKQLASDDDAVWHDAFARLSYLDPRLAVDLITLMAETPDDPARGRLTAILSDEAPEASANFTHITLTTTPNNFDFTGIDQNGRHISWLAIADVAQLTNQQRIFKKEWLRADRILAILAHNPAPDAAAFITAMAGGEPEAEPTKVAAAILAEKSAAATRPATAAALAADMETWWTQLESQGASSADALLHFADHPAEATAFFKPRLLPLILSADDARAAIDDLAGDAAHQQAAYDKLSYFDLRLALTLPDIFAATTTDDQRMRLLEVLSDLPQGVVKNVSLKLSHINGRDYITTSTHSTFQTSINVSELEQPTPSGPKQQWRRAIRAELLLAHFQTPDALAILRTMATGNEDASPTQIAKAELDRLAKP